MTLEGVDALLRWVSAVVMGWHEFQFVFVFIHNNVLERLGAFIVHCVDSWTEAALIQISKNILVYSDMFRNRTVFHGAYNNYVCAIDRTHNYVFVAPSVNGGKTTGEIRCKKVTCFDNGNANIFGPSVQ